MSDGKTEKDTVQSEDEGAAGPWGVRTMGLIWRRDDETGITCGTIDVTDPHTLIDPQILCDLLNEYEARPEGHVAVYLPVETVKNFAAERQYQTDVEFTRDEQALCSAAKKALATKEGES